MANVEDQHRALKPKSPSGISRQSPSQDSKPLPKALNAFFACFETHNFSMNIKDAPSSLHPVQMVEICQKQVVVLFQRVNIHKASGPEGI